MVSRTNQQNDTWLGKWLNHAVDKRCKTVQLKNTQVDKQFDQTICSSKLENNTKKVPFNMLENPDT